MSKAICIHRLTSLNKAADALFDGHLAYHPEDRARFKAALDASMEEAVRDLHEAFFPAEEQPAGDCPEPLQLREGGYYRARGGEVYGPMRRSEDSAYPWTDDSGLTWTDDGCWYDTSPNDEDDLIEEVSAPEDQPDGGPFDSPARNDRPAPTTKTVVVMRSLAEASDCWDMVEGDGIRPAFASMPHTLRQWTAERVYVSEAAAEVPGLLEQVRARQASFPNAVLTIAPIEEIRDALANERAARQAEEAAERRGFRRGGYQAWRLLMETQERHPDTIKVSKAFLADFQRGLTRMQVED